jgi:hypothetical protein
MRVVASVMSILDRCAAGIAARRVKNSDELMFLGPSGGQYRGVRPAAFAAMRASSAFCPALWASEVRALTLPIENTAIGPFDCKSVALR